MMMEAHRGAVGGGKVMRHAAHSLNIDRIAVSEQA
jgi:hypothetical protein